MNQKEKEHLSETGHTLLLLLASLIWGAAFVAQSIGAEYVGAYTFLACRSWIAAVFLSVIGYFLNKRKSVTADKMNISEDRKPQRRMLIIASLFCGVFLFTASAAQQIGIAYTTTAKSGFLTAMYVVIVPILSIFLGHRPGWKIWMCVVLSVAGLYLLCIQNRMIITFGDSVTLLCALLFSFQIMGINHFAPKVSGIWLSAGQFLVTAVLSTIAMFLFERPVVADIQAAGMAILYAGIMSSGIGYTLQIIGQRKLKPSVASLAMCMESVFSALAGWIFLHQNLTVRELCGCGLMFAAIVLSQIL